MTRGGGARSLGSLLPKLARPVIGRHGFREAGLLADWPAIAGVEIARRCQPERLEFPRGERMEGTLHLRVEGAWALAIQHLEPQLVERINASLGYRAIARLKLFQGALAARAVAPPPPASISVGPEARRALKDQLAGIEDAALREAVERLGLALLGQPKSKGEDNDE